MPPQSPSTKSSALADSVYNHGRYTAKGPRASRTVNNGWAHSQEISRNGTHRDLGYENVDQLVSGRAVDHR
ncbi:MAG: hypothetical protein ABWX68_05660 [Arthrobacter sp.]|uniref:hypothetical protein n=1 Tax=Arthrobacter sp. TaxID=1667 RepID=UPI00347BCD58